MPKQIEAGLLSHLGLEVTTLATCWDIERRDGTLFRFTDHDRDITVGGEVYKASVGYSRTAIANDAAFNVDNLDIEGLFDDESLTEADLRSGRFDFAEVRLFIVNWQDPDGDGILRERRGYLGEVQVLPSGTFKAELRGMAQRMTQTIGELYSTTCRADLGDSRCKVPISPLVVERDTVYALDDVVLAEAFVAPTTTPLTIVNPGAELGTFGWLNELGTLVVSTSSPHGGANKFTGGTSAETIAYQDIAVPAALEAAVDAGDLNLLLSWWQNSNVSDADTAEMIAEFTDDSAAPPNLTAITSITGTGTSIVFPSGPTIQEGDIAVFTNFARQSTGGSPATVLPDGFTSVFNSAGLTTTRRIISYKVLGSGDIGNTFNGMSAPGSAGQQRITVLFLRPDTPVGIVRATVEGAAATNGNPVALAMDNSTKLVPAIVLGMYGSNSTISPRTATPAFATEISNSNNWYTNYTLFNADPVTSFTIDMDDEGTENSVTLVCLEFSSDISLGTVSAGLTNVDAWTPRFIDTAVPATTRKIRLSMRAVLVSGVNNDGYFDDIAAALTSLYGEFDNVMFRCTVAGTTDASDPGYDSGIGNTTVDGTATFTAEESWTRTGVVTNVDDEDTVRVSVTESRAVDDWFSAGGANWITGNAAGLGSEIKTWLQSTGSMSLYLPSPAQIVAGDIVRMYPGCDKRLPTCRDKFDNVFNRRAEDYIPGADALMSYPDAKV